MMDDRTFDRAMRDMAAREALPEAAGRLSQVLSSLPDAPAARRSMGRRLIPALAAALLICATAVAAQMGLFTFWDVNPYNLFHNRQRVAPEIDARPLRLTDASGLRLVELSALDAAWIEGRLTLTVRLTAQNGQPLSTGLVDEDGMHVEPGGKVNGASGPVLLMDGFACYTRPEGVDGWPDSGAYIACEPEGEGMLLLMQLSPDFITRSDLPVLTEAGVISLRLEMAVWDASQQAVCMESALLAAPAPTDAEKEEMNP